MLHTSSRSTDVGLKVLEAEEENHVENERRRRDGTTEMDHKDVGTSILEGMGILSACTNIARATSQGRNPSLD